MDAFFAAVRENAVTLDGVAMRTHEQIDAHFALAFGPEDEEQFNRFVERIRPRRLSDAERAERDRAHEELSKQEAAIAEFERRTGCREIEAQKDDAYAAVWDAEYEVMEAKPASPAGAVALRRFLRREGLGMSKKPEIIRNAPAPKTASLPALV